MAIFREYVPTIGYEDRTTDEVYAAVRDQDTATRLSLVLFKKGMLTPQEFLDVLNLQGEFVVRDDL